MKNLILLFTLVFSQQPSAQCDIKTTVRPDGVTMKYFTPKPVARTSSYEAGLGLYLNNNTGDYTLSLFLLFKKGNAQKVTSDLLIQTTSSKGIRLKAYRSEIINMNDNAVATTIYILTKADVNVLKHNVLKTISFNLKDIIGMSVTENANLLISEFKCLSK